MGARWKLNLGYLLAVYGLGGLLYAGLEYWYTNFVVLHHTLGSGALVAVALGAWLIRRNGADSAAQGRAQLSVRELLLTAAFAGSAPILAAAIYPHIPAAGLLVPLLAIATAIGLARAAWQGHCGWRKMLIGGGTGAAMLAAPFAAIWTVVMAIEGWMRGSARLRDSVALTFDADVGGAFPWLGLAVLALPAGLLARRAGRLYSGRSAAALALLLAVSGLAYRRGSDWSVQRLRGDGPHAFFTTAAISKDGLIAALDGSEGLYVWDAQGRLQWKSDAGHYGCAFSADGATLIANSLTACTATVYDARTGALRATLSGHGAGGPPPAGLPPAPPLLHFSVLSPDGRFALTSGPDNTVRLWNAATGAELRQWPVILNFRSGGEFSPDGKFVVVPQLASPGEIVDLATLATTMKLPEVSGAVFASAGFTPDGKYIAAVDDRSRTVSLWNAADGSTHRELCSGARSDLIFSPDGQRVIVHEKDGDAVYRVADGVREIELRAPYADGRLRLTAAASTAPAAGAAPECTRATAFAPDGKSILGTAGDRPSVWDAATGTLLPLPPFGITTWCGHLPDGTLVSLKYIGGSVEIWRPAGVGAHLVVWLTAALGIVFAISRWQDGRMRATPVAAADVVPVAG